MDQCSESLGRFALTLSESLMPLLSEKDHEKLSKENKANFKSKLAQNMLTSLIDAQRGLTEFVNCSKNTEIKKIVYHLNPLMKDIQISETQINENLPELTRSLSEILKNENKLTELKQKLLKKTQDNKLQLGSMPEDAFFILMEFAEKELETSNKSRIESAKYMFLALCHYFTDQVLGWIGYCRSVQKLEGIKAACDVYSRLIPVFKNPVFLFYAAECFAAGNRENLAMKCIEKGKQLCDVI